MNALSAATDFEIERIERESIFDYSDILRDYSVPFFKRGYYLEFGDPNWVQGWILDISVIVTQIQTLLEIVLPVLVDCQVPFKLAANRRVARAILDGELGYSHLGKVLSIYPDSDKKALELAQRLIKMTSAFKGPRVLTDIQLGGVVYTRYGSVSPIVHMNKQNIEESYIYDYKGDLVRDPVSIPFILPAGVGWAYKGIASPFPEKRETVLQDRYKPLFMLKEDAKGSVRKGLWLEKIYRIRWCVLKEGNCCMLSDQWGRDIEDRLRWQYRLQKELESVIPIPKAYELFKENGNTYLAMEFISGVALDRVVSKLLNGKTWPDLSMGDCSVLLGYIDQILEIVGCMHTRGYIHRDIAPNNFLVDKKHRLWMIDLELSFCVNSADLPHPFRLGTPGFISPEQEATETPTVEQDVYSLGSIIVHMLTGLFPGGLVSEDPETMTQRLKYFLGECSLVEILTKALSSDPCLRPSVESIQTGVRRYMNDGIDRGHISVLPDRGLMPDKDKLRSVLESSLWGLSSPIFLNKDSLWLSRTEEEGEMSYYQSLSVSVYKGFYQGLSGILFVLGRANRAGFSISPCLPGYQKSLESIVYDGKDVDVQVGGFYAGTYGMALSLIEGIRSGLIGAEPAVTSTIFRYLENENITGCGIASGLAGRGLVLLDLESTNRGNLPDLLRKTVDRIIDEQKADGSWIAVTDRNKRKLTPTGFSHGVAGITCFLLEYIKKHNDPAAEKAATRSLHWLMRKAKKKNGRLIWYMNEKSKQAEYGMINGVPGIALCFMNAYEVFRNPEYKTIAVRILEDLPDNWTKPNLTLATGLSGIGQLYLEAAIKLESPVWQMRANGVAGLLLNYFRRDEEGGIYWATEGLPIYTAGLMSGNCGIIDFLLRLYSPSVLNHPLLTA